MSSPWVDIWTLEASPADLANFTVEQREQGRALLLSWDQPSAPNGIITVQNIQRKTHQSALINRTEQMSMAFTRFKSVPHSRNITETMDGQQHLCTVLSIQNPSTHALQQVICLDIFHIYSNFPSVQQ